MNLANGADKLIDGKQNVYNIALPKHFFCTESIHVIFFFCIYVFIIFDYETNLRLDYRTIVLPKIVGFSPFKINLCDTLISRTM